MAGSVPEKRNLASIMSQPSLMVRLSQLGLSNLQSYQALIAEGWRARKDLPAWRVTPPVDWRADPFRDSNWQVQLHFWRFLDPTLRQYFRKSDVTYLEEVVPVMLDWWRAAEHEALGPYGWHDMATGMRALRLALVLDRLRLEELVLGAEEAESLVAMGRAHLRHLTRRGVISLTNHGLFQVFGLRLLAQVMMAWPASRRAARRGARHARRCFARLVVRQYTPEGVHREHSPDYHSFLIDRIERLGGADLFDDGRGRFLRRLEKAWAVRPWLTLPDGVIAPVGDSIGGGPLAGSLDGELLVGPDGRSHVVGDFHRSGYVVVRSGPTQPAADQASMLLFSGMAHGPTHKHADDLSFVLYENRLIFTDAGKYGYNEDAFRDHVISTDGHNTVGLADRAVMPAETRAYGSALARPWVGGEEAVLAGRVKARADLFDHRRTLRYRPGRSLLIYDELSSRQSLAFASRLLLAHDLSAVLLDERSVSIREGEREIAVLRLTVDGDDGEGCIHCHRGVESPRLLGWVCTGYQQMAPATLIEAVCPGRWRVMTWSVELSSASAEA